MSQSAFFSAADFCCTRSSLVMAAPASAVFATSKLYVAQRAEYFARAADHVFASASCCSWDTLEGAGCGEAAAVAAAVGAGEDMGAEEVPLPLAAVLFCR